VTDTGAMTRRPDAMSTTAGVTVIAHRGDHRGVPENSIAAFYAAAEAGFDMIETDLRRCRDGIVTLHDARVDGRPVVELSRVEIRELSGSLPPLLDDVIECCRGRIAMDLELKEPGLEEEVVAALQGLEPDAWLISSFSTDILSTVRSLAPRAVTALLSMRGLDSSILTTAGVEPDTRSLSTLRAAVEDRAVNYLAPDVGDGELLAAAEEHGWPLLVWYANDAAAMRVALDKSCVRGVITDQPALLQRNLGPNPPADLPAW
jgi:glycerophosphoryl diester phosphodiesterase